LIDGLICYNVQGAGSALLDHATKLGKIVRGMVEVSGEIPITIKMRMAAVQGQNVAHKLMPKAAEE
jgi:tRNA-dihydrouridine synthase 3